MGEKMKKFIYVISLFILLIFITNNSLAEPIQWKSEDGGNNHWYDIVDTPLDWTDAKIDAESSTYDGCVGHLVTITSIDENLWITNTFGGTLHYHWIGGYQPTGSLEPAGGWSWITGEEWAYNNWILAEPNNSYGDEDVVMFDHGTNEDGYGWNDNNSTRIASGYVIEYEFINISVGIDIKPGSYPNSININGSGLITVAILGSDTFDVSNINIGSLVFAGLDVAVRGKDKPMCKIEDVSGNFSEGPEGAPDGYPDLVCHFEDDPSLWSPADGTAEVTGLLNDGTILMGIDEIRLVP